MGRKRNRGTAQAIASAKATAQEEHGDSFHHPGGKKQGNKRKKNHNHQSNKKRKKRGSGGGSYWVETCTETKPKKGQLQSAMTIVVSRSQLVDDHMPIPTSATTTATEEIVKEPQPPSSTAQADDEGKEPMLSAPPDAKEGYEKNVTKSIPSEVDCDTTQKNEHETDDTVVAVPPRATSQVFASPAEELMDPMPPSHTVLKDVPKLDRRLPFIKVMRAESAKKAIKRVQTPYTLLPNGDNGDGIVNPFKEVDDKYWAQRKRLFSRFDDGLKLDKEGWYSVTPEVIANHIASRVVELTARKGEPKTKGIVVLEAFCGCGGNAIAFGKRAEDEISCVVCVDIDRSKLEMAAHNASIYGIPTNKLIFVQADCTFVMSKCYKDGKRVEDGSGGEESTIRQDENGGRVCGYRFGGIEILPPRIDVAFLSPPWGGPSYEQFGKNGFCLEKCIKVSSVLEQQNSDDGDDVAVDGVAVDDDDKNLTNTKSEINGEQLLELAANATGKKLVVYFLPKNMNGISLGRAVLKAGFRGFLEMEQNVVNGKLKTITGYFGKEMKSLAATVAISRASTESSLLEQPSDIPDNV